MDEIPIEKVAIDLEVELIANEIRYRGIVVSLDAEEGKITLKDAKMIKGDAVAPCLGQLRFFRDDIQMMKFVDHEAALRKMDPNYLLMKPFRKPSHLRGQTVPTDEDVLKFGRTASSEKDNAGLDDETTSSFWSSTVDSHVVDVVDESFTAAVAFLQKQKILAVAGQGVLLSRQGELCWLAIGVPTHTYLFDVMKLGEQAFTQGLADILQSTRILKIIHDCRFLSDYLYHKFQLFLQNVWDTQVARVVVYKHTHFGELPRFVESLPKLLQDTLGVDPNKFPMLWCRSYALEKDQSVWRQRPLPEDLQRVLEAEVAYLWDLRNALLQRMMQDLTVGVDVYLKAFRDATNAELDGLMRSKFLLPLEFYQIADASKERYIESSKKSSIDPLTGFRESVGRLSYWKLRFSRDAWHGEKGTEGSALPQEEDEEAEFD